MERESKIQIRMANQGDLPGICQLYDAVHTLLENGSNYCGWYRGKYPTREVAENAIARQECYVLLNGEEVAGTVILNHEQAPSYRTIDWKIPVQQKSEALVLHTLAVHPAYRRNGTAKKLIQFAENLAKQQKCKTIRFDTAVENAPAIRLYEQLGYAYRGEVGLGLDPPFPQRFRCYEKQIFL